MAQVRVTVCLPGSIADHLEEAIEAALAPFELYCDFGVRGMWDRWTIRGGSDSWGFNVVPGYEKDPRLVHDSPRWDGELLPSPRGRCAGGPRELLDLARAPANPAVLPDLLTLDGWWIEWVGSGSGRAVHGECESPDVCPHMTTGMNYLSDVDGYLRALPPDTLLVKVKCHA